jgi:hypothetical protein
MCTRSPRSRRCRVRVPCPLDTCRHAMMCI